jgi:hypothetical protein
MKKTTKETGDIAEYRLIAKLLELGYHILTPIGDRLPYDLVVNMGKNFCRIQTKMAWKTGEKTYSVDHRRHKTNQKKHTKYYYNKKDFDVLAIVIPDSDNYYFMPIKNVLKYSGQISCRIEPDQRFICGSQKFLNRFDIIAG